MRVIAAAGATAVILLSSTVPALNAVIPSQCSDRNKLNGVAVDARLVAIELYYDGLINGLSDGKRKSCYEAPAFNDDKLAIVNKTLELVERDCSPVARAARIAAEGVCP